MGNRLFGINISGIINKEVGPGVLAATLIKVVAGSRTPGSLTSGTNPTEIPYGCRGFIDSQSLRNQDGSLVDDGSRRIVLIGDSIASAQVPEVGDKITIESRTYRIATLDRDPAAATYTCMCFAI